MMKTTLNNVSAKLATGMALALLVLAGVSGMNYFTQRQLQERAASIAAAIDAAREVAAVRASLSQARRHEQEAILAVQHRDLMEVRLGSWTGAMNGTTAALLSLRGKLQGVRLLGPVDAATASLKDYERGFQQTQRAMRQGLLADAAIADGTMAEARKAVEAAHTQLEELAQRLAERSDKAQLQMTTAADLARNTALSLMGLLVALVVLAVFLLGRTVTGPRQQAMPSAS